MADDMDDDEYIATLLKEDAKKATDKYALVGMDAFNPKRLRSGAPKPNTNFLRHIIRQTDSHNAALLAKEAEESNARLKSMNREKERARRREDDKKQKKFHGRLTPVPSDDDARQAPSRKRRHHSEDDDDCDRRRRRRGRDGSADPPSRRHRDRSKDVRRGKKSHESSDEAPSTRKSRHSRSHRDKERRHKYSSEEEDKRSRRREHTGHKRRRGRSHSRSMSRSRSRSRSRSPGADRRERRRRYRDRSHSPRPVSGSRRLNRGKTKRRSVSLASDSDPLEAIVGPLPPPAQPVVRARGRGAHKANSMGIESRFSTTYDPSIDVRQASDVEDDWGDALEALRDRQRWKQQGADRLKAAGFTDEQVKKWEKGDVLNEDDVVWTRKGQAREWDRGKVVDEEGDVELKADFGRLK